MIDDASRCPSILLLLEVGVIGSAGRGFPRLWNASHKSGIACVSRGRDRINPALDPRGTRGLGEREGGRGGARHTRVLQLSRIVLDGAELPPFNKSLTFLRRDIFPSAVSPAANLRPPAHGFVRPRNARHSANVPRPPGWSYRPLSDANLLALTRHFAPRLDRLIRLMLVHPCHRSSDDLYSLGRRFASDVDVPPV